MAATVKAFCANGAGPTNTTVDSADAGAIKWGRDDSLVSTTAMPVPTATGEKYSYLKYLFLDVTGTAATSLSNRRIALASGLATGLFLYFKDQATYTQNNGVQGSAAGNYPADVGTNGTTPAGYTLMSTSNQLWDNTSVSAGSTGKNGDYAQCCLGADFTFVGGGGTAAMANILTLYDEQ